MGPRRGGSGLAERIALDRLARWVCMVRAGAALVEDEGREQWYGPCQRCGSHEWLSWCHIFTRGTHGVRWNPDNTWAWCRGCHRWLDQHWNEKQAWVVAKLGQVEYERLALLATGRHKTDKGAVRAVLLSRLAAAGVKWRER